MESRDSAATETKPASEAAPESMAVESASEGTEHKTETKTENAAAPLTPANMKEKHYQMQLRIFSAFEQMQICKLIITMHSIRINNIPLDARPTAYSPLFAPFNELRNDLLIMFELQKLVAEKSYELQCVREQRRLVQQEQQSLLTQDEPDVTVMTDD